MQVALLSFEQEDIMVRDH